jgi:putative flippase GtrA
VAPPGAPLPFADGAFDLVTTLDVLEHIDDDVAALAEVRRVLRPRGLLLAAVPAFMFLWGKQDEVSHHQRRYTARTLRRALGEAGFEVDRTSYFNTVLFPPIALVRLGRRLLGRPGARQSDFELGPARLNGLLGAVLGAEAGGLGMPYRPAAVFAGVLALVVSFVLNRHWTFLGHATPVGRQAVRYVLVFAGAVAVGVGLLTFFVEVTGAAEVPAQVAAILIVAPCSFVLQRAWVFGRS